MMANFVLLTPEEIVAITGYKRKSCQSAWLRTNKVKHSVNCLGNPIVSRSYWESLSEANKRKPTSTPNWSAT